MREILFRGKRLDDGEWVDGYLYITHNGEHEISIYNDEVNIERWTHEVDPSTVGQYTGLKDKHGKRIFEGDILKWDSMEWGCDHLEIASWDYELFNMRRNDWEEWCEVIGNIHDNPKLCSSEKA